MGLCQPISLKLAPSLSQVDYRRTRIIHQCWILYDGMGWVCAHIIMKTGYLLITQLISDSDANSPLIRRLRGVSLLQWLSSGVFVFLWDPLRHASLFIHQDYFLILTHE